MRFWWFSCDVSLVTHHLQEIPTLSQRVGQIASILRVKSKLRAERPGAGRAMTPPHSICAPCTTLPQVCLESLNIKLYPPEFVQQPTRHPAASLRHITGFSQPLSHRDFFNMPLASSQDSTPYFWLNDHSDIPHLTIVLPVQNRACPSTSWQCLPMGVFHGRHGRVSGNELKYCKSS